MNKNQGTKEKICTFFASDYHFEMVSLPYINKKIEDNEKVIVLTENNLEETVNVLLSRINLKEEKKKKILNINWKNDDFNKFKEIKKELKNNTKMNIFIKGRKNYINNINKNIETWLNNSEFVDIIDCYDIEEIGENINDIMSMYQCILSTSGKKEIEKL